MKLTHKMKVYRRGSNGTSRPEIRLLGNWLDKIGFQVGQEISVTILDDMSIRIERANQEIDHNMSELNEYFDKKETNLLTWIRKKGGIKIGTVSCDTYALNKKQSGLKTPIMRRKGLSLDVLRDEAEWENIIAPGTTTDQFKEMIENQIRG